MSVSTSVYNQRYYIKNVKAIEEKRAKKREQMKENRYMCECGSIMMKVNLKQHISSKKHINFMEKMIDSEEVKNKIENTIDDTIKCECGKTIRQVNKIVHMTSKFHTNAMEKREESLFDEFFVEYSKMNKKSMKKILEIMTDTFENKEDDKIEEFDKSNEDYLVSPKKEAPKQKKTKKKEVSREKLKVQEEYVDIILED